MKNLEAPGSWKEQILRAKSPIDKALIAGTVIKFGDYGRAGQHLEQVAGIREAIEELAGSQNEEERILGLHLRHLMEPPETRQA